MKDLPNTIGIHSLVKAFENSWGTGFQAVMDSATPRSLQGGQHLFVDPRSYETHAQAALLGQS